MLGQFIFMFFFFKVYNMSMPISRASEAEGTSKVKS